MALRRSSTSRPFTFASQVLYTCSIHDPKFLFSWHAGTAAARGPGATEPPNSSTQEGPLPPTEPNRQASSSGSSVSHDGKSLSSSSSTGGTTGTDNPVGPLPQGHHHPATPPDPAHSFYESSNLQMAAPKHVVNRRWTAADLHTTARAWPTDPTPPTDPAAAAAASTPKPATAGALVSTRVPQQRRTATFHTPAAPQSLATVPYGPRARSLSVSLRSLQAMRSLASQHAPFALKEGAEGGGEQLHERQGGDVAPVPDLVVVRRASAHVRRLCVEWRDLGCSYDTHAGTRVVLQVRGLWCAGRQARVAVVGTVMGWIWVTCVTRGH